MPEEITSIGEAAFYGCSSLYFITLPQKLTYIGPLAFYDCRKIVTVTLPETLTFIGSSAFENCRSLASIVIPEGVTSIGNTTFRNCNKLTSITLPSGLTTIDDYVFSDCSSLTSLSIPSGVTYIGNYAISYCTSLTSITIPAGVTFIGDVAFSDCSLREIHCVAKNPVTCGSRSFYNVDKNTCTLYVPKGSLEAYKKAYTWKDFVNIVEEEYTGIEEVGAESAGQAVITACGDGIVVENFPAGKAVTVYTLSGTVVYEGVASGSRTELTLPAGHLYLVKCGPTVTKVAL